MFDEPCQTPFHPRKRKQGHVAEVEDGSLLGFAAFKDLQGSGEEGAEEDVPLNIQDLWVVPKRATHDANIGDVYGVGLEDEDEDSDDEDLNQAGDLLVACLLTFITLQPFPPPPLTLPRSWSPSIMWMRRY